MSELTRWERDELDRRARDEAVKIITASVMEAKEAADVRLQARMKRFWMLFVVTVASGVLPFWLWASRGITAEQGAAFGATFAGMVVYTFAAGWATTQTGRRR